MVKNQTCLLAFMVVFPISSMELEEHHKKTKSRSGSNEFVTINILPQKEDKKEDHLEKKEDRKTQLKVAAIAAAAAVASAGITAAITLTISFTHCDN